MKKEKRTPDYIRLRQVLVQSRTNAGMAQADLAAILGKPQSYVSKIEAGERGIDVVEYIAYVRALNADPIRVLRLVLGPNRVS